MKASHKQLKAALALRIRKLGPTSVASNLGEFLFFDCFLNLAKFQDLDVFWLSGLLVFGSTCFDSSLDLSPPSMSPTSLTASILAPSTSLAANTCDDIVVFSINVSGAAILLKPLMNQQ